jgi:hypothetical protein
MEANKLCRCRVFTAVKVALALPIYGIVYIKNHSSFQNIYKNITIPQSEQI